MNKIYTVYHTDSETGEVRGIMSFKDKNEAQALVDKLGDYYWYIETILVSTDDLVSLAKNIYSDLECRLLDQ